MVIHGNLVNNSFRLRRLKIFGMGPQILENFYSCTIESILTGCITTWYGNYTVLDRNALQRVMPAAKNITGVDLPAIQDLYIYFRGMPKKLPKTPETQAIDCSLYIAQLLCI
jgi:hypothetical protein